MWDVMQIIMLMYVSVTVPLRVCFDIAVPVPGAEGGITAAFWADMVPPPARPSPAPQRKTGL